MVKNIRSLAVFTTLITILPFTAAAESQTQELSKCKPVIAHEMGIWEFSPLSRGPHQVSLVAGSKVDFVKVSLRRLKDGIWVVAHDEGQVIKEAGRDARYLVYSKTTWDQIAALKKPGNNMVPIWTIRDYVERDPGKLCWMFSPKDTPDDSLLSQLLVLGLENRTVLLSRDNSDTEFYADRQLPEMGLAFAPRVGSPEGLDYTLKRIHDGQWKVWAIEVDPNGHAQANINGVKAAGFKAYLDSMRYSSSYELGGTACMTPFGMGADYTQTNRPIECLKKLGMY